MMTSRAADRAELRRVAHLQEIISSRRQMGRAANDDVAPDWPARIVIAIGQTSAAVASLSGVLAAALFLGR